MRISPEVKIFAVAPGPRDLQKTGIDRLLSTLVVSGSAPRIFSESMAVTADVIFISWAITIVFSLQHGSLVVLLVVEGLFLLSVLALLRARRSLNVLHILAYSAIALGISTILNSFFHGNWGDVGLYTLCGFTIYRFPLRWAAPLITLPIMVLLLTDTVSGLSTAHTTFDILRLFYPLLIAAIVCWAAWTRRTRHLLIVELQNVQAQLRAQIAQTEELATARERARIARDIHDVLAHTLTILSIQVQAARQLVQQNPEKLSPKLDDMALLLRESIAESRRVVGLLREAPPTPESPGNLEQQFRAYIELFGERTGIRCTFVEEGTPQSIGDQQRETLQFALKEGLTNAHRHGAARNVKASLNWHPETVRLSIQDDGSGGTSSNTEGTNNGLRGMRERATALGGSLEAGFQSEGGFAVTLSLPLKAGMNDAALSPAQEVHIE